MTDSDCVAFLQWALPRLRMRWLGFRKVRGQVRKRLHRRVGTLGLGGIVEYRAYLEDHPDEWKALDSFCRVTISRFYRDRKVFDHLASVVLPRLAEGGKQPLRCWSAGCGSGEEAYTLQILWHLRLDAPVDLIVEATDTNADLLDRARRGVYAESALADLPADLAEGAFEQTEQGRVLKARFKKGVVFRREDIREMMPPGPFDILLCRNLVFTYYDEVLQSKLLSRLVARLRERGVLVVGQRELPPLGDLPLERESAAIYRRNS